MNNEQLHPGGENENATSQAEVAAEETAEATPATETAVADEEKKDGEDDGA